MGKGRGAFDVFFASFYCVCAILFIGPICLFVGLAIIGTSLDDDRGRRIHAYNVELENWKAQIEAPDYGPFYPTTGVEAFRNASFSVDVSYGCGYSYSTYNVSLAKGPSPLDRLKDTKGSVEKLSPQLKFYKRFGIQVPKAAGCYVTFDFRTTDPEEGGKLVSIREELVSEKTTSCNPGMKILECKEVCERNRGEFRLGNGAQGRCIKRRGLRDVCIKVDHKEGYGWRVDTKEPETRAEDDENFGCFYKPKSTGLFSLMSAKKYFLASNYQDGISEKEEHSTGHRYINLMVRSSSDPWLHYLKITHGNGDFGTSTLSKLIFGSIFLALGVLFTFLEAKGVYYICYYKRHPEIGRPTSGMRAFYYDQAHRDKRYRNSVTTGIPVHMVAPNHPYMVSNHNQAHQNTSGQNIELYEAHLEPQARQFNPILSPNYQTSQQQHYQHQQPQYPSLAGPTPTADQSQYPAIGNYENGGYYNQQQL